MAKAARSRKTTATRTPRKKRGAKLLIEGPNPMNTKENSVPDENLRERCLNYVTGLSAGKEMKLSELIDQAKEIYEYIKDGKPTFRYFGSPVTTGPAEVNTQPDESLPESETTTTQPTHRSRFEETREL